MSFKIHAPRRHKNPKALYAVNSWQVYEAALRQRGDSWIWIGDDVESLWTCPGKRRPKGYPVCTDLAIEAVLTLRQIEGLNCRPATGRTPSVERTPHPTPSAAFSA